MVLQRFFHQILLYYRFLRLSNVLLRKFNFFSNFYNYPISEIFSQIFITLLRFWQKMYWNELVKIPFPDLC